MSKVVIRIGDMIRDSRIVPCFAVDVEERKGADAKWLRPRIEREHARLVGILREGLDEMLCDKAAMNYVGAKVVITISRVRANPEAHSDGKCRVDVQTKNNCPREYAEGAWKLRENIVTSPKVAAEVARMERERREELNAKRVACPHRSGDYCVALEDGTPPDFGCECYECGKCREIEEAVK